ncbi:MAG: DNA polymerase III subunit delta [Firmicutes bacterium]|nr:DNA polymerase III subunit delta [Bacillota bacterium]
MKILTEADYKSAMKTERRGAYVLFGEEDYLISHYRGKAREPFADDEVNYTRILYSASEDADAIVGASSSLPFMSGVGYRLVEVTADGLDMMKDADFDALLSALSRAAEFEDSLLIMCLSCGTFDFGALPKRPSARMKRLIDADGINPVYFPKASPAQLRRWIERHFERAGIVPEYGTSDRMLARVGDSMTMLSPEIDKAIAYLKYHERARVTPADIDAVCAENDGYGAFELSNSILDGRVRDALSVVRSEAKKKTEPAVLLAGISRAISDMLTIKALASGGTSGAEIAKTLGMHEYRVGLYMKSVSRYKESALERAMSLAADAEERMKSSRFGYEGVERLLCEISLALSGARAS